MRSSGERIISVVGTRPEAIKMAPVVRAISARGISQRIILTGQHSGLRSHLGCVANETIEDLGFDTAHQSAGEISDGIRDRLRASFLRRRPELVLVQGDTSSALAGALAARDCAVPLGHVEAGLRSFDLQQPWPEEGNRIAIDRIGSLLFAPTEASAENLRRERVSGAIHVTGNSGIDALLAARGEPAPPVEGERRLILVTCHRRENRGAALEGVIAAINQMVAELPVRVLVLLHPNPIVAAPLQRALRRTANVELRPAAGYQETVRLMDRAWAILTDSGGIQEEAPALGTPVLVLRDVTEREEAIASGNCALVGTDPARIVGAVERLIEAPDLYARMSVPAFPFGHGGASERIAALAEAWLRPSLTGAAPAPYAPGLRAGPAPSSSGPGRRPLTAKTRVRVP